MWHHDIMSQTTVKQPRKGRAVRVSGKTPHTGAGVGGPIRTRITARIPDEMRGTLEQAAELLGATVNQFVVQTAYIEAQKVIERETMIRLSQKSAQQVLALMSAPPRPTDSLKEAVKAFKSSVRVQA